MATDTRTWQARVGTTADRDSILACRQACFAGEELEKQDPAFWQWEFVDNHAGPARHFVADDNGAVVGWYAVIPQKFRLNGKPLAGSIVVDVMTHPDYRFQGMFTALGRASIETCTADPELEFTTGYPIRPEVIPGHLKVGWKERFAIGIYALPLSIGAVLKSRSRLLRKIPFVASVLGSLPTLWFRARSASKTRSDSRYKVETLTECDASRFGPFWEQIEREIPEGLVIQERDPGFLSWRYDKNPGRSYRYYVATSGSSSIDGYLITRTLEYDGLKTCVVADALALAKHRDGALGSLLAAARRDAIAEGCGVVALTVTQPNPLFPDPRQFGFLRMPAEFTFITREYSDDCPVIVEDPTWHLMYGDTDDV